MDGRVTLKKQAYLDAVVAGMQQTPWDQDYVTVESFPLPKFRSTYVLHPNSTQEKMWIIFMSQITISGKGVPWIELAPGVFVYHYWFNNILDMQNVTGCHSYLTKDFHLFHPDLQNKKTPSTSTCTTKITAAYKTNRNHCYICQEKGLFYESYCLLCAVITFKFRLTVPSPTRRLVPKLLGKRVLVTGGRIKIGFGTALACLRLGAEVTVTTRFGALAKLAYAQENDSEEWMDRLTIIEVDFLETKTLVAFINWLSTTDFSIIVQNAAQTVKNDVYAETLRGLNAPVHRIHDGSPLPCLELMHTQAMQVTHNNSWFQRYNQVPINEMLENLKINVVAPFLVMQAVGPTMKAGGIVLNVTSSEGDFRKKSSAHIHNNMCKAALDQMTVSLHTEFRQRGIRVDAVDPGFLSSANPTAVPPLTLEDAVARLLQPMLLENAVGKGWRWKDFKVNQEK